MQGFFATPEPEKTCNKIYETLDVINRQKLLKTEKIYQFFSPKV